MKLYNAELSGNCYKIRLFLSLLGIDYQAVAVNMGDGDHKKPDFLRMNPRGQLPVLDDQGIVIWDSMAILVYLARKYGAASWLPTEPESMALVMQWLALSENEILYGLARARAVKKFSQAWDLVQSQQIGMVALSALEGQLKSHAWLVGEQVTIADLACYPYVALAPEGEVSLDAFPSIQQWIMRIQALPGYDSMPGLWSNQ